MRTLKPTLLLFLSLSQARCTSPAGAQQEAPPAANEAWLTPAQIQDARIQIRPVAEEDVGGVLTTSGRIAFDDLQVSHVYSPVNGRVVKILAQLGERVQKSAPLAVIESPDLGSADSDRVKAEADLRAAGREYQRQRELYQAHAGSQKDYETAQASYGRARAEYERARSKIKLLRAGARDAQNQEYTLRAPIDGEIVARSASIGAEVQGQYSGGTAVELFTVGALETVWVMADVFEIDLGRVKTGARASVHVVAYPNEVFSGTVDWVADTLDPSSRTARVRCRIKNPGLKLKPEMYATMSISVAEHRALAVPRGAILRLADRDTVFVQSGSSAAGQLRFERRPIAVDEEAGGDLLPVTQGLRAGERVVASGAILLSGMLR